MKHVGLVTCYVDNFGACLQAYALQKTIIKLGNTCEIVRYTPVKELSNYNLSIKALKYVWRRYKSITNKVYDYELGRKAKFKDFRKKRLVFGSTRYPDIDSVYANVPQYDAYIVGSDQLWNPMIHNETNNKVYFLDFAPRGKKRIAYAPSIGLSVLPDRFKPEMADMLAAFDALSTREQAGADIVAELTDRPCRVVLDPTLLLTDDEWGSIAVTPRISEPYIFCYLFGQPDYIGKFVEYVAEKIQYKVVVIPFVEREYNSPYLKVKKAGPLEFIGLIKNAALVITDSFHATAFSINFNTPFYSLLRNTDSDENNMNSRIFNILSMTKLEDRLITAEKEFPSQINTAMNFALVNTILARKRNEDSAFLKRAIDEGK